MTDVNLHNLYCVLSFLVLSGHLLITVLIVKLKEIPCKNKFYSFYCIFVPPRTTVGKSGCGPFD